MALKATIYTLGCRLNQADAGLMADALRRCGYSIVPWGEPADVLVVNSCTVTSKAAQKTRHAVRAARRRQPNAFIAVVGCDVDVDAGRWQADEAVDLAIANAEKRNLPAFLPERLVGKRVPSSAPFAASGTAFTEEGCGHFPHRTRAHLKVQEGCNFACSYCIAPKARGPARSRLLSDVLREAKCLVGAGYKELVLTGVNIAWYEEGGAALPDLVRLLLELEGEFRVRMSSTEPGPVLLDVLDVMSADERVCRFLHLPMQYGEDGILRAMGRRYTVAEYAELAQLAVERVPGLCLGSDVMIGFPGETAAAFSRCLETVKSLPFGNLHIFTYSPRPGTVAASLPGRVPKDIAAERQRTMADVAKSKSQMFAEQQVGHTVTVLTEQRNDAGHMEGWSDNYLRVEVMNGAADLAENQFARTRVVAAPAGRVVQGMITGRQSP